jgi:hypothetical protein
MSILSLLVALILIGLLFWGVRTISAAFAIPPPVTTVIYVLLVIVVIFWLLQSIGGISGGPVIQLK